MPDLLLLVIITFDDGYLDVMTQAEPVLEKYGLRGIVYLVTDYVSDDPARRRQFTGALAASFLSSYLLRLFINFGT